MWIKRIRQHVPVADSDSFAWYHAHDMVTEHFSHICHGFHYLGYNLPSFIIYHLDTIADSSSMQDACHI